MANGYFDRGEIYWVSISDFGGNEVGGTRPGLIISANAVNKIGQVTIAYLTTSNKDNWEWCVPVDATGRHSYVKCDTVCTVMTSRLRGLVGVLNSAEQKAVDDVLEKVFDLGYVDDTALKEKDREIEARDAVIAEKDAEIAALKAKIAADKAAREDELNSYKVENAMWQRLYDKALGQVVDMKFAADVAVRGAKPVEPVVAEPKVEPVVAEPKVGTAASLIMEPPKPEVEEPEESESTRVDINHCTITRLKRLGFSLPMARLIVSQRPFKDVEDLKRVPGMKATQFRIMEPKLCCTPIAEPVEKPVVVKDEGGEDTPVEQPVVSGKVNVNTATAQEIHDRTGLSLTVCFSITGTRKRDGLFKSVDDVRKVDRFPQSKWDDFMELIEV